MSMTKEQRAAYMRKYYKENLLYIKRYKHAYHIKHREAINARRRYKYATDPEFRKWDIGRHKKQKPEEDHD